MNRKDFRYLKKGDAVTRMLAGQIPVKMKVTKIVEDVVHCGAWSFDRDSGYEIDDDIPMLVSFLIHNEEIN